jgi:phenylacetate-CoA ligase
MHTPVFDCYGHNEIVSSGIAAECEQRNGLHINEDHFIAEIVNPDSGEILGPGETGELVITTLTKEAFPLIRYKTGDITHLNYEPCACGSNFVRMDRISSRTDDMVFIGGVNLFPSQVERIIATAVGTDSPSPAFQLVLEGEESGESVEVLIEVTEAIFSDELRAMRALEEKIRGELFDMLGVTARVRLVEPGKLSLDAEGAERVVDRRDAAP